MAITFSAEESTSFMASEFSLDNYLSKNQKNLTVEQVKNIFGQIVLSVAALHDHNLVHRDLKNQNVFVDIDD
ncbi:MAG: protein kinase [Gammaproteobacteria bacterium]